MVARLCQIGRSKFCIRCFGGVQTERNVDVPSVRADGAGGRWSYQHAHHAQSQDC
jgi:hypothetical protein